MDKQEIKTVRSRLIELLIVNLIMLGMLIYMIVESIHLNMEPMIYEIIAFVMILSIFTTTMNITITYVFRIYRKERQ